MICPYCKKEITNNTVKYDCNESMFNKTDTNAAVENAIYCNLSNKMKKRFNLIKSKLKGTKFGLPYYDKLLGSENFLIINFWAFFFNIFYYLFKGMWRKALTLLILHIIIVIPVILFNFPFQDIAIRIVNLIVPSICLISANYDLYRKIILKETFWW